MRKMTCRAERLVTLARGRIVTVMAVALLLGACAQTRPFLTSESLAQKPANPTVLIMPPDVELSEVMVSGMLEPNAAWTATGRRNIDTALDDVLTASNAVTVRYKEAASGTPQSEAEVQLIKLHQAVGSTILFHKYLAAAALPTKKDKFDWSLGNGATALRDPYGADYALFVYFRDTFSSGGRTAFIIAGALLGVAVQGGSQTGFASLVDLRDGQIVWMNIFAKGTGDLREPESAQSATESLLNKMPL